MDNNRIKVSVIIPVYNGEKYLRECLDSVLRQTLKEIEIICVNDGSIDNTLAILSEYSIKDKRIVVISQKNYGLSTSRNNALKIAKGQYIYYLDADDLIDIGTLEQCYNIAEKNNVEIVTFCTKSFYDDYDGACKKDYIRTLENNNVYSGFDYFSYCVKNNEFYPSVWLYFYKKSFIEKIFFIDGIVFEDTPYNFCVINSNCNIYFVDYEFHHRRVHYGSITTSDTTNKKISSNVFGLKKMVDYFNNNTNPTVEQKLFLRWVASTHYMHIRNLDDFSSETLEICKEFNELLKKNRFLFSKQLLKEYIKLLIKSPLRALKCLA